tara:strand:- start:23875 stop:24522 length:648 start_codon:yes stop_codon:yes gene_type:complete
MNYFSLFFLNKSILRTLQIEEFKKERLIGKCIEFGANSKIDKNFLEVKHLSYKSTFSNLSSENNNIIKINLEKKLLHKKKYDNVVIFNVLEHLSDLKKALKNTNLLLKKNGKIIGSTPFLYRIHGAPKDYSRYTKDFIKISLKQSNYKNIKVKELGTGPFLASFSLLRGIFKFIPLFYQLFLGLVILLDKILLFFMKTDPKNIYPVGYIFSAKKK